MLRNRGVQPQDFDVLLERVMAQAEALFADWPVAA